MTEAMRHEIVQHHQAGMSIRAIAEAVGVSRGAVTRALARVQPPPARGETARRTLRPSHVKNAAASSIRSSRC